jgi:hypothetical protein
MDNQKPAINKFKVVVKLESRWRRYKEEGVLSIGVDPTARLLVIIDAANKTRVFPLENVRYYEFSKIEPSIEMPLPVVLSSWNRHKEKMN